MEYCYICYCCDQRLDRQLSLFLKEEGEGGRVTLCLHLEGHSLVALKALWQDHEVTIDHIPFFFFFTPEPQPVEW